jgi:dihydroorotase
MSAHLIKNARIVNEGKIFSGDILIKDGLIERIESTISNPGNIDETNAEGKYLIPGIIDDQVHFREPGLTHKASIYSESKAAVAGGVTSFMEMPNTHPQTLTQELLEEKYLIGQNKSLANFSFYMGASNSNIEEVLKTNPKDVCGIKIFMGSSTGDMLVDDETILEKIFANSPSLISTHCESEAIIKNNLEIARKKYGDNIPPSAHPIIRDATACFDSSCFAVALAKKYDTRLNVFHISTADEISLFAPQTTVGQDATTAEVLAALATKKITSEICVHHLYFSADDYETYGNLIKCNPAIKAPHHKAALFDALLKNQLDLIATDHAPHTWEEKQNDYLKAPAGIPLVQHALNIMLGFYHEQKISLEKIVEKMCHAPAVAFKVSKRGFIREGYFADLVLVDIDKDFTITKQNVFYKCGWSPLIGQTMKGEISHTFVNGHLAYQNGIFDECQNGMRLTFNHS